MEAIPVQELVVALAPGYIMVVLEAVQVSILANQADPMSKVQQVVAVGRGIVTDQVFDSEIPHVKLMR